MRIVHVANFGLRARRVFLHSTAVKLSRGWTLSGHHVIDFPVRDLAHWMSPLGLKPLGRAKANHTLLKVCEEFEPDVVAFGHADIITLDTLATIKATFPRIRTFQWNYDWWVTPVPGMPGYASGQRNRAAILSRRDHLDATFITQAGTALSEIATTGHRAFYMPNPVDRAIESAQNFTRSDLPYDVFFSASSGSDLRYHCGQWREMGDFCQKLGAAVPDAKLLLPGIGATPQVFGPAYQRALESSKIGLNISRRNDLYLYSSDRISHMMGNGLAVAIDRASGYGDIFGEDEMIFYSSEDELFDKIGYYVRNDAARRALAEAGYRKYHARFNSATVAQHVIDYLTGRTGEGQAGIIPPSVPA